MLCLINAQYFFKVILRSGVLSVYFEKKFTQKPMVCNVDCDHYWICYTVTFFVVVDHHSLFA